MGRIITPKYRVEYRDNLLALKKTHGDIMGAEGKVCLTQAWNGRVTAERLEDWRKAMNKSFQPGGCNEHITKAFNIIPHIFYAAIVRQSDKKVMCNTNAPTFEVV